jgi:hypothetical protein
MTLGAHLVPRARSEIERADVVFAAVSDPLVELWLQRLHADVRSLQPCYGEGKSRHRTYREMVDTLMAEVRAGKRVCGAFYGHPGVFAQAPHEAIAQARREGFDASMEPGISAEDCLYADLGIDPGRYGCQHYEASQFMFYRRRLDTAAYLVLWQVGIAGDRSFSRRSTGAAYRRVLVDLLLQDYPPTHQVIVYEAATLAIAQPRRETVALNDLAGVDLQPQSTLVVPPCQALQRNDALLAELDRLDAQSGLASATTAPQGEPAPCPT